MFTITFDTVVRYFNDNRKVAFVKYNETEKKYFPSNFMNNAPKGKYRAMLADGSILIESNTLKDIYKNVMHGDEDNDFETWFWIKGE